MAREKRLRQILLEKIYLDNLIEKDGGSFSGQSLEDSYKLCAKISKSHYENFPVASLLAPKEKRKYVQVIYTFARLADDIADESNYNKVKKIEILDRLEEFLILKNAVDNPLFKALYDTLNAAEIPEAPLLKLLKAFKMDSDFNHPQNLDELFNYCDYSANPVGEIVLRIFDEYDSEKIEYSDSICTGLQLANFWQDLSRDLPNNRVYIPNDILEKYNISIEKLGKAREENLQSLLNELYLITANLFKKGEKLPKILNSKRLRLEINLTLEGGKKILSKTKRLKTIIFVERPKVKKLELFNILLKSFFSFKN